MLKTYKYYIRCNVALLPKKNEKQCLTFGAFGVTVVSLWAPNGTPEAVLLEVEILMAKRVLQEQAEAGKSRWGGPLKYN